MSWLRIASSLLMAATACAAQTASPARCLSYEPAVVKLEGALTSKTYSEPSTNEGGAQGNKAETYWLLKLPHPICVDEDPKAPDLNSAHKDLGLIQLVVDPATYKSHSKLVGKRVIATGTLFGGSTAHHHTLVLLTVTTLEQP